jgi:hypothetical protein
MNTKSLSLEQMENLEGGWNWTAAAGCGAGIGLVALSVGYNIFAFAAGVLAIDQYCGDVRE